MRKIRVVHYCHQFGLGGTEKTAEIFCRNLNRQRYEVFAASLLHYPPEKQYRKARFLAGLGLPRYRAKVQDWESNHARIPRFREVVGEDHLLLEREWAALREKILAEKPDVLHVHYGGAPGPPISDEKLLTAIPITVATHVFDGEDNSPSQKRVARMLFISRHLLQEKATWARHDARAQVLYYPIEKPQAETDLRKELGIPRDAFVLGRVGRPASSIHHAISLEAYRQVHGPKTYFLALAAPFKMQQDAARLKLKNFYSLPPTADETYLSRFYNTIDVLAHARRDGETFGCNIAEAMIHGKTVVSHRSPMANAQEEIIGDTGFITDHEDVPSYASHLRTLRDSPRLCLEMGEKARQRALEHFEAGLITRKLEAIYEELLAAR